MNIGAQVCNLWASSSSNFHIFLSLLFPYIQRGKSFILFLRVTENRQSREAQSGDCIKATLNNIGKSFYASLNALFVTFLFATIGPLHDTVPLSNQTCPHTPISDHEFPHGPIQKALEA
jgi:hypothetical protein